MNMIWDFRYRTRHEVEQIVERLRFYANPDNLLFTCEGCGKRHLKQSGRTCPCGRPFDYKDAFQQCRQSS